MKTDSSLSPSEKAHNTAKWARTMTKWLITYSRRRGARWNLVEFGGPTGAESRGIVDLLAIRKDHKTTHSNLKRGDTFDIVLIQVKGGGARWPSKADKHRLRRVAKFHRAQRIVLAEWKRGQSPTLYGLKGSVWEKVNASDLFG